NSTRRSSTTQFRRICIRPVAAAPYKISEKVVESIKNAEETCSNDPVSGECTTAWDEVEELSAAASHARDKPKSFFFFFFCCVCREFSS
ncbi:calvin cycle protein cp12-2 chloroplastic, partial [Phtheirospermum japonicum]